MANMSFEEFKQEVMDNIRDYLPEKFQNAEIILQQVTKNNDTVLDGLCIREEGNNIAPNIYINAMYEDYQQGKAMEEIMTQIADMRVATDWQPDFDVAAIMDYDQAKDHIVARLVNLESNEALLSDRPYTQVEDLAVTYHIQLGQDGDSHMSIPIQNAMMEHYGVSVEEMHETAMKNTAELNPPRFTSMHDMMKELFLTDVQASREEAEAMFEMMMPPEEGNMWVLTNQDKMNGAIAIMNPEIMDQVHEQLGGDFFILPSSIHECLVVPMEVGIDIRELEDMVQSINMSEVQPEERLSDHVYTYDAQDKEIYRADKEEQRQAEKAAKKEKTADRDSNKRTSVADRMKDKQKQVKAAKSAPEQKAPKKKDVTLE